MKTSRDDLAEEISKKLNVLIALHLRSLGDEKSFAKKGQRNKGVGEVVRYLASMGLDATDISKITGAPLASVRTLLTPGRMK